MHLKNKLKRGIRNNTRTLQSVESPQDFFDKFEEINSDFEEDPLIRTDWKNFSKSLIFPKSNTTNPGIIQTPAPAKSFFEPETYLSRSLNVPFFNAVPNYLTGAGIFFTFVGLAAGIYQARSGFGTGDVAKITTSLSHLLGGASLAFSTSIVGLFFSIVFSIVLKRGIFSSTSIFDEWHFNLDRLIPMATSENFAYHQLEELKVQSGQLQRFNTELAISIAEALDSRISSQLSTLAESIHQALTTIVNENVGPRLDTINKTMEGIKADRGESLIEMLKEISNQFRETLHGAAGKELDSLATAVTSLVEEIKASEEMMGQAQRQVNETVMVLVAQAKETLEQISEAVKNSSEKTVTYLEQSGKKISLQLVNAGEEVERNFREVAVTIEKAVDRIEKTSDKIQSALTIPVNGLKELITELSGNTENLKSTAQESDRILTMAGENAKVMGMVITQLKSTISQLGQIAQSFELSAQKALDATKETQQTHEEMKSLFTALQAERRALTSSWDMYQQRFDGLDQVLKKVFEEINSGLNAYVDNLKNYVTSLEKYLADGVSTLSGAVGEMREVVEELSEQLEELKSLVARLRR